MEDCPVSDRTIDAATSTKSEAYPSTFELRTCQSSYASPYRAPANNPTKPSAPQSMPTPSAPKPHRSSGPQPKEYFKLRGLNLPGMGGFDGRAPSVRSARYTRKPPGSEEELKNSSMAVQADWMVEKRTCYNVVRKMDAPAVAPLLTAVAQNQEVPNAKLGEQADWRVSKTRRQQKKAELQKLVERFEQLEKRHVEERGGQALEGDEKR